MLKRNTKNDKNVTAWHETQFQDVVHNPSADFTDDNVLGGVGESHTLGLNWLWNPYARMQFNAGYGNIHDHAPVAGQTFGQYTYLGTRFMVDF